MKEDFQLSLRPAMDCFGNDGRDEATENLDETAFDQSVWLDDMF